MKTNLANEACQNNEDTKKNLRGYEIYFFS